MVDREMLQDCVEKTVKLRIVQNEHTSEERELFFTAYIIRVGDTSVKFRDREGKELVFSLDEVRNIYPAGGNDG